MTTTPNTTASGATDALRAAITRAFNLGQTYWQQADSESYAEQDKSDSTYKKYKALLEETCTTLAASAPVAPAPQPAVPKKKPLPDLMMASYHEAIGWNACVDAMHVAAAPKAAPTVAATAYRTPKLSQRATPTPSRQTAVSMQKLASIFAAFKE